MKKLILPIVLIFSGVIQASDKKSDYQVYKIKKGDTLSELLSTRVQTPLYKKGGSGAVDKSLYINRLNQSKARKLEIGSYVILPKNDIIVDTATTSRAANSKDGLLSTRISRHQNIEVSAKFYKKEHNFSNGGKVSINQNYEAKIKVIGNRIGKPSLSAAISNSTGINFENNLDKLVELKPSYGVETSYYLLENDHINIGPVLQANEESNIDYTDSNFEIRRDQYLWLGAQAATTIYYKKFELDIEGSVKQNVITESLTNSEELSLTRAEISGKINLTRDYYVFAFYSVEASKRSSKSFGIGFIYKL